MTISFDSSDTGARHGLNDMLLRAHEQICGVIQRLRQSRDAFAQATAGKIQHTSAKLLEVSSATELAANGILDGLERAATLVDELDTLDQSGDARAVDVRSRLRDELFQAIGGLQFQDITSQQLRYAGSILGELETRLADLATALDPNAAASFRELPVVGPPTFDPGASVNGAETRQALADSIFESNVPG